MTQDERSLFDHAKRSLPRLLFAAPGAVQEWLQGFAAMFAAAKMAVDTWLGRYTFITKSPGPWLDARAWERGLRRQAGESDAALAARCRSFRDVVTLPALRAGINAILAVAGLGPCAIVELRKDKAFTGRFTGGHAMSYASRGYRTSHTGRPNVMVVILPYGTSDEVRAAVDDFLRITKAGGYGYQIEVRLNP